MQEETKHKRKGLSFIRVLDHDYSRQLQIPQEFTSSFNGCLPHRFIIEDTVTKKCWRVETEEDVDSQMYLREGWHDFVESHSLEVGNFLLFECEERSIFHVKVYDRNGCEKICGHRKLEKNAEPEEHGENESFKCDKSVDDVIAKPYRKKRTRELCIQKNKRGIYKKRRAAIKEYSRTAKASISETSCSFSITLHKRKKHQFIQLTIPKVISLPKLLRKEKVMLLNAEGGCWPAKITSRRDGRWMFGQGWKKFMKDNEFAGGDTLNFEFISDDVVQVRATKTARVKHRAEEPKNQIEAMTSQVTHNVEESNNQIEARYIKNKHGMSEKDEAVNKKIRSVEASISGERVGFSTCLKKSHQFIQIVVPMAVSLKKLRNKRRVTLQDEKGICWQVYVARRRNGQALFSQGWNKFLKGNGFTTGDVLEFEFVSDDLIQVRTTKASLTDHHSEEEKYENEVSEMDCEARGDDNPVTTLIEDQAADDSIPPVPSLTEVQVADYSIPTEQVCSELGTSTFSITGRNDTMGTFLDIPTAVAEQQNLKNKETAVFPNSEGKKKTRSVEVSIRGERVCFSTCLQKSHQFIQISIPMAVSLKKLRNQEKVTLQDEKGIFWQVQLARRRNGQALFGRGWKEFLTGNGFTTGDVLEFEFVSDDLIQVGTTKASVTDHHSEEANYENEVSKMNCEARGDDNPVTTLIEDQAVDDSVPPVPTLTEVQVADDSIPTEHVSAELGTSTSSIKWRNDTMGAFLTVPMAVTLRKLRNKDRVTLQDEKGSCWQVNVSHRSNGQALFTKGWKKFLKDNGFTAGDVLDFEFVSDDLIQVRTRKPSLTDHHSEEAKYETEPTEVHCEAHGDDKPVPTLTEVQAADDSIPPFPTLTEVQAADYSIPVEQVSSELGSSTFSITWRKDTMGAFLDIPTAVAEQQNLKNKETVVFCDPEGKFWPLQVRTWWDGRIVLTKGWVEFWKGHAVTEGDSLHFEFVTEYLVQVTINRGSPTLEPVIGVVGRRELPEPIIREVAALPKANAATF